MAQVIQHLPSKHKALSSNPSTDQKNTNNVYRGKKKSAFNNRKLVHIRKTRKPTKHSRLAIN
jgi:hypothetical protein